ncbi:LysR family transcriptional regulator [Mesorhizobium sp. L-8-10]|uniref:LysR family transcriptional regulator n=1 Tax=unclassified Mesorhizobium TaxID=325217 RepID=UPI0019262576|nr:MULTISPECIES: LysR family transcriptional regulator [unclassified Mesorhizobium]BCH20276.1 LysR family transcriptional regulator [Mesorhizobium sp. L-8-3]BCH28131.1 LysR family transcriptional regulator [Mesorhizobium sp. L-8-10]
MLNLVAGRYFLEVARAQSIRQAADRLQLAPSAISRQISKLEHDLNIRLVERRSGGVVLTEAGRILVGHLEEIFDRVDRIEGEIADLQGLKGGTVTVATVEGITRPFLADQIASFRKTHSAVNFRVRVRGRMRVLEALEQHICQIGFIYDHYSHPMIETVGSWRQPLLALAGPSHPFADGREVTLHDLAEMPCVLPDDTFGIHHLVKRAFSRIDRHPRAALVADQFHFLAYHASNTGAVIYLPLQAALNEVKAGLLVPLNLKCPEFEHRHIHAVVRANQQLPPAAAAFLRFIVEAFAVGEMADAELMARLSGGQS